MNSKTIKLTAVTLLIGAVTGIGVMLSGQKVDRVAIQSDVNSDDTTSIIASNKEESQAEAALLNDSRNDSKDLVLSDSNVALDAVAHTNELKEQVEKLSQDDSDTLQTYELLGMTLTENYKVLSSDHLTREIDIILSYIDNEDVINRINNEEFNDTEIKQYVKLLDHLTQLKADNIQRKVVSLAAKVEEAESVIVAQLQTGEGSNPVEVDQQALDEKIQKIKSDLEVNREQREQEEKDVLEIPQANNGELESTGN